MRKQIDGGTADERCSEVAAVVVGTHGERKASTKDMVSEETTGQMKRKVMNEWMKGRRR